MRTKMRAALKALYPNEFEEMRKKKLKFKKPSFLRRRINRFKMSLRRMGKIRLIACLLSIVFLVVGLYMIYSYNKITTYRNNIFATSANIDSEKQRRNDLINNLIPPTLNYSKFERQIFLDVATIRKELTDLNSSLKENVDLGSENPIADLIGQKMPSLVGIFENYPDLKASKPFTGLMTELIETENRVAAARSNQNAAINVYNTYVEAIPAYWVAFVLGYESNGWFKADEEVIVLPDMKKLDSLMTK